MILIGPVAGSVAETMMSLFVGVLAARRHLRKDFVDRIQTGLVAHMVLPACRVYHPVRRGRVGL